MPLPTPQTGDPTRMFSPSLVRRGWHLGILSPTWDHFNSSQSMKQLQKCREHTLCGPGPIAVLEKSEPPPIGRKATSFPG